MFIVKQGKNTCSICFEAFERRDIKLLVFLKESDLFFSAQAFATNIFKSVTKGKNIFEFNFRM